MSLSERSPCRRRPLWTIVLAGLAVVLTPALANARLQWQDERVVLSATSFDAEVTARYRFRNVGLRPIRLLSADGACSCTIPNLPKDPVAPGATGTLEVTFVIGDRVGREERTIRVVTDDAPDAQTQLALVVNIREQILLRPRLVFWLRDAPKEPRTVTLRPESGLAPIYGDLEVLGEGFSVRLTAGPAAERSLVVEPIDTRVSRRAEIRIPVSIGNQKRTLTAFAVVQ